MGKYPILSGSNNATVIEVFTPKDNKPPALQRGTILPNVSKDTKTTWWGEHTISPNVFLGINQNVICHRIMQYDDCTVKVGIIGNSIIHEFEYAETALEVTSEYTENVTTTRTRSPKKKFDCETIDICSLTYGDARKLFLQHDENKAYIEQRIFDYEARNRTVDEKVIYEGALICPVDMYDKALSIIKSIADTQKKHTLIYNR